MLSSIRELGRKYPRPEMLFSALLDYLGGFRQFLKNVRIHKIDLVTCYIYINIIFTFNKLITNLLNKFVSLQL